MPDVLFAVADRFEEIRKTRDPGVLRDAARDPDVNIRVTVARRGRLPADVVDRLARDPEPRVAAPALRRAGITDDAIRAALGNHPQDRSVWSQASRIRDLPADLVELGTIHPQPFVRQHFAHRDDLTAAQILSFAVDNTLWVRVAVAQRLNPEPAGHAAIERLMDAGPQALSRLMLHDWISHDTIRRILNHASDPFVDRAAAMRSRLPDDLTERFASSDDWRARANLAGHGQRTPELLARLAEDPKPQVVAAVLARDDLGDALRLELLAHRSGRVRLEAVRRDDLTAEQAARYVADNSRDVRAELAGRSDVTDLLSDDDLYTLACDPDRRVRTCLSKQQGLPAEAQAALILHGHRLR